MPASKAEPTPWTVPQSHNMTRCSPTLIFAGQQGVRLGCVPSSGALSSSGLHCISPRSPECFIADARRDSGPNEERQRICQRSRSRPAACRSEATGRHRSRLHQRRVRRRVSRWAQSEPAHDQVPLPEIERRPNPILDAHAARAGPVDTPPFSRGHTHDSQSRANGRPPTT